MKRQAELEKIKAETIRTAKTCRRFINDKRHKKYKDLVPKITEAFKAMKQDGTYEKIKDKTLPKYIK